MSQHIMITCPTVNAPVRTGYRAAPGSAIDGLKRIRLRGCPGCDKEHLWDGKDGYWVAEYVPEPSLWAGVRRKLLKSLQAE